MNVFHRFTLASLRKNRTRTLVTLIGIVLSMALMTAVIQGANSGLDYLVRAETERVGAFHGYWQEVKEEDLPRLTAATDVERTDVWRRVGYAEGLTDSDLLKYLQIESIPEGRDGLVSIRLSAGRLPENDRELAVSSALLSRTLEPLRVGDTLTLSVGERTLNGEPMAAQAEYDEDEALTNTVEHTYTVVGIYERFDHVIESYRSPSSIALTRGEADGAATVFFTLGSPARFYETMNQGMDAGIGYGWTAHSDLLAYSGSFRNGNLTSLLYGAILVLVLLIAFGSISLIYNSFSISVSDRTRQFGILRSVGATKRQLRGTVLYEALVLCAVAIPVGAAVGCLGIGITLFCLRDSFSYLLGSGGAYMDVRMKLTFSLPGLAVSVVACLAVTLISAWIPAKRAMSVSPITSIRQTEDLRVTKRAVRVSPLTKRLFRFEGLMAAKNFKRNRRRYRSTVVSLFLSVVLFISAAAFCNSLTAAVESITAQETDADLTYYLDFLDRSPEALRTLLASAEGVERVLYHTSVGFDLSIPESALTDRYLNLYGVRRADDTVGLSVVFLADSDFLQFCKVNGIDGERYLQADEPLGLLYNSGSWYREEDESGNGTWATYELLRPEATKGRYRSVVVKTLLEDGRLFYSGKRNAAGDYLYFTEEQRTAYYDTTDQAERDALLSLAAAYPPAAVETVTDFALDGTVADVPFGFSADRPFLLYPYSAGETLLPKETVAYGVSYLFKTTEHETAYSSVKSLLTNEGIDTSNLADQAQDTESLRATVTVVNVFAYGFIILISLIAVANVFNTISTSIALRRRELAMLRSVGMTERGMYRMLCYECLIYGFKGLAWGLPVSFLAVFGIWLINGRAVDQPFSLPWSTVAIAVFSVFAVVFATMLYAAGKLRRENTVDALKNENL